MKYLHEHAEEVVRAIRDSKDLLSIPGAPWETTAWARSMGDAVRLWQLLREAVWRESGFPKQCTEVCVGLVLAAPGGAEPRWGVVVRLRRP